MGTRASSGFTIIETLLFLGVTGLLVLGALIGVGTNVNIQRYRDSAETFKNVMQQQYASVTNVQNGRDNNWRCTSAAGAAADANGVDRGQSSCVVVGKYVRIQGGNISTYTVLALERFAAPAAANDISSLKSNYILNISKTEVDERTMEWNTEIAWPKTGYLSVTNTTPRSVALLFIRSPDSGQVYTFSSNTVPSNADIQALSPTASPVFLTNMIVAGVDTPGQGQVEQVICVESSGLFDPGKMALYISPYAASTNAVELMTNTTMTSRGVDAQC